MSARAGIVVTGTEVLTGRVVDRNGPWLAERLREAGVDIAHIAVVGDRPEDIEGALRFFRDEGMDLVVTSGGLGPTADDLTARVVGDFQGRPSELDGDLEGRIWNILQPLLSRWPDLDPEALRASNRKQAMVPRGATVLEPVGTAPGLVVPPPEGVAPTVVVLPGPPRELQPMWETATQTGAYRAAVAGRVEYRQEMLRLFGIPESEIAETLRIADERSGLEGLEITTCLRRGEVEVVTRFVPAAAGVYAAFAGVVRERHADTLFSDDGSTVDEQVAGLLREGGLTIATAESCTGGLLAGRLTERGGSSDYVLGGLVVYANEAKVALAGVDPALIESRGAVSTEVADALADGARAALGADVGVGITGIAGPGGGTEDKPVGLVCFSVAGPGGGRLTRSVTLPGARVDVRDRSTTVALHMVRRLLSAEQDSPGVVSPAETARLFAALELPGPARSALASWGARVAGAERGVRLVPIGSLHVTLVFLGSRPLDELQDIADAVVGAARALAPLTVTRAAWLPPRRPGVLVADLAEEDDVGALAALHADLVAALAPWHEPEARGFRPHVTVARVRRGARIDSRQPLAEPPVLRFAATALVLYRSHLGGAGASYEAVASAPLG